jgi:uncharacterized protein GlcG (DUF336 family)
MMNLEMAKKLLQAGMTEAKEKGTPCSIAIVDDNGWLVALHRMDGAPIPTSEIARDKAWTAAAFRLPSSKVPRFGDPKIPGYGLNVQNWNERLTTIPGGLPIWKDGRVIGAIGVCSQSPKKDVLLCQNILKNVLGEQRHLESERGKPRKRYGRR